MIPPDSETNTIKSRSNKTLYPNNFALECTDEMPTILDQVTTMK
jgi:hypothetical protein